MNPCILCWGLSLDCFLTSTYTLQCRHSAGSHCLARRIQDSWAGGLKPTCPFCHVQIGPMDSARVQATVVLDEAAVVLDN